MDSPQVAQLFRQLFHHRPRGCLQNLRHQGLNGSHGYGVCTAGQSRSYAARPRASKDRAMKSNESRWQQRNSIFPEDRTQEFAQYPELTVEDLKTKRERPQKCKMLMRDFIDGGSPAACDLAEVLFA